MTSTERDRKRANEIDQNLAALRADASDVLLMYFLLFNLVSDSDACRRLRLSPAQPAQASDPIEAVSCLGTR